MVLSTGPADSRQFALSATGAMRTPGGSHHEGHEETRRWSLTIAQAVSGDARDPETVAFVLIATAVIARGDMAREAPAE